MKTSKKLNLSDLKIESFITSLEDKNSNTVKAGTGPTTQFCAGAITLSVVSVVVATVVVGTIVYTVAKDDKICDSRAICGNTHDGGNGCSVNACG